MRIKIAAIGSSATLGFQIEPSESWPAQLEKICNKQFDDVEVQNRATHGLALQAYAERIVYLENEINPDLYLLQIPVPGRLYLGINGKGKLKEEEYSKDVLFGWSRKNAQISPTRLLLTSGEILNENSPFHKFLKSYYFPTVKRNNSKVSYKLLIQFIKFWHENIRFSDLDYIYYGKEIYLVQQLLAKFHKPYFMFRWDGPAMSFYAEKFAPFYSLIDFDRFILQGKFSVLELLKKHYPDSYESFLIDEYGHLNQKGNQVVAEDFVFPSVISLLQKSG